MLSARLYTAIFALSTLGAALSALSLGCSASRGASPASVAVPVPVAAKTAAVVERPIHAVGDHFEAADGTRFQAVGFNYYPAAASWGRFWSAYDEAVVEQDFAKMAASGATVVRTFVHYRAVGGAHVSNESLAHIEHLLDTAHAHHLKVILTLFDLLTPYAFSDYADANAHLRTLLRTFRDHPAIFAWDLKNEADRDRASAGVAVDVFLRYALEHARIYDDRHMITIGWSTPDAALGLAGSLDFISYHDYLPLDGFAERANTISSRSHGIPVVLEEFGSPTFGGTEAGQSSYFSRASSAYQKTHLAGAIAWSFSDFREIAHEAGGRNAAIRGREMSFGLVDVDGREKTALRVFPRAFRRD